MKGDWKYFVEGGGEFEYSIFNPVKKSATSSCWSFVIFNLQTAPLHIISLVLQRWRETIMLGILLHSCFRPFRTFLDYSPPTEGSARSQCMDYVYSPPAEGSARSQCMDYVYSPPAEGNTRSQCKDYVRPVQRSPHRVEHDACVKDSVGKKRAKENEENQCQRQSLSINHCLFLTWIPPPAATPSLLFQSLLLLATSTGLPRKIFSFGPGSISGPCGPACMQKTILSAT